MVEHVQEVLQIWRTIELSCIIDSDHIQDGQLKQAPLLYPRPLSNPAALLRFRKDRWHSIGVCHLPIC